MLNLSKVSIFPTLNIIFDPINGPMLLLIHHVKQLIQLIMGQNKLIIPEYYKHQPKVLVLLFILDPFSIDQNLFSRLIIFGHQQYGECGGFLKIKNIKHKFIFFLFIFNIINFFKMIRNLLYQILKFSSFYPTLCLCNCVLYLLYKPNILSSVLIECKS